MITKPVSRAFLRNKARLERREKAVQDRKRKRLERRNLVQEGVSEAVTGGQKELTIEDLDNDQMKAFKGIHLWWKTQKDIGGVAEPLTIGGYAGTGKSTLLSIALPALRNADGSHVRIRYCAYTGKAASVLLQKSLPAQTLHSLIYHCEVVEGERIFILKDPDELEADLVVVDEASMVPDDMREDLESLGIAILYTGDHGQLPPVKGEGNVMVNPVFKLETVHRQALESGIIKIATDVRQRKPLRCGVYGARKDVVVKRVKELENDTELLLKADMVVCYKNTTRDDLNVKIRSHKGYKSQYPTIGEKLICVQNNKKTGMYNGLVLLVKAVKKEGSYLLMDLVDETGKEYLNIRGATNYFEYDDDGNRHPHPKQKNGSSDKLDLFEFAYAITGHKSQGSQWDNLVVIEERMFRQKMDIRIRWKYTTITRAAKQLTFYIA